MEEHTGRRQIIEKPGNSTTAFNRIALLWFIPPFLPSSCEALDKRLSMT
jgi:hypothetical protein